MAKSYIRALRRYYGNIPRGNAYYKLCKRGKFGYISEWHYDRVIVDSKLIAVNTRNTYLIDFVNWCNKNNILPKQNKYFTLYTFSKEDILAYINEGYEFHYHWCTKNIGKLYEFDYYTIRIVTTEYKTAELKQKGIYPNYIVYGSSYNYNRKHIDGKVSDYKRLLSAKQQEDAYTKQEL